MSGSNNLLWFYSLRGLYLHLNLQFSQYAGFVLLVGLLILLNGCGKKDEVRVQYINALEITDIVPVKDSLVIPVDYRTVVPLDSLDMDERKQKFIDILLPSILITKYNLKVLHRRVNDIYALDSTEMDNDERQLIDNLLVKYRADDVAGLLEKLETHPASIALAQAALESAWGTSRFFYEGNNPFGIWSFYEDEPRIASLISRDGNQVFLKKYTSLLGSVQSYFRIIATGPYPEFRKQRVKTKNAYKLIPYLYNYSELGHNYIERLRDIIRQNDLTRFDNYEINPDYIR